VLQNRPDLKIAEYSLKAAHTNVGVAYASLFPAVQLDGFFGGASASNSFATPANYAPFQDEYVNWGINPSTFGKIEAGKGAYQAQVYKYIQTVRKILQDVDNAFSANRQYSRNYQDTQLAWQDLANKYQLQQGLYKIGTLSYPQLLESKIILDNLILSVNQARLQQAISLVNLYQDLAGGYKYHQSESTSQLTSD
jgi:outer membrane protein TolC